MTPRSPVDIGDGGWRSDVRPLLYLDAVEAHVSRRGSHPAIVDGGGITSFDELWHAACGVACRLLAEGVEPGDRVAIAMGPTAPYVAVILGGLMAGAVVTPVNTRLTSVEIARYLDRVLPTMLVADSQHAHLRNDLATHIPSIVVLDRAGRPGSLRDQLEPLAGDERPRPDFDENAPALILPTGGTTGLPKGAVATHRALRLQVQHLAALTGRRASDVELCFSPFFHLTLVVGPLTTLAAGGCVRLLPRFDVDAAVQALASGVSLLFGTPTMFTLLRAHPDFHDTRRDMVRHITTGGAPVSETMLRVLLADFPNARISYGYASTETGVVTQIPHEDLLAGRLRGVGRPHVGVDVRIVDSDGRRLPAGCEGEIAVTTPWQMSGYWAAPVETAGTWQHNGVQVGDVGLIDDDGWLHIMGRSKELIITGGENVYPAEVEHALVQHEAIASAVVYAVPDETWGERVEAAIVLAPGVDVSDDELIGPARLLLAGYKLPRRLRRVAEIPLTPNNKPDRAALAREAL